MHAQGGWWQHKWQLQCSACICQKRRPPSPLLATLPKACGWLARQDATLPSSLCCRWLWRAALHEPWSTATHSSFPPAFKAAARSLLLAANRSRTAAARAAAACRSRRSQRLRDRTAAAAGSHEGVSPLGTLPPGVLLHVLGLSAYPLSAWKPEPDGGSLWQTLRELWEENNPLLHPLTF